MSVSNFAKDTIALHFAERLSKCETREQCMDVSVDVRSMITMLDRIAEEDCYDRAMECDKRAEGR